MLITGEIEVSQPEEIKQEIKPEEIGKLLEKAKDAEWKFLLKLERWARQGSAYDDTAEFEIVYGDAEEVVVREWDSGYPYTAGEDVLLIPKTIPVVVIWRHYEDTGNGVHRSKIVYIFTKDGWKSVEAY
jgi:hypothetical protein